LGSLLILKSYYRESIWNKWVLIYFIGIIVILSSVLVVLSIFGRLAGWTPKHTYLILTLIVALSLITLNFRKLNIKVNSENIEVGYGIIKKKISLNEVVSCEPTMAKGRVYLGFGIRLGVDGSLAYTTSFGSAVKIMRRKGRPFVFSTKNPEKLSKIINEISKS
jgi:hypothetical protein